MMPMAYQLKRVMLEHRHRFWCADELAGIATAPVYLFPDQARLDSDEVDAMARAMLPGLPRLPHDQVLFEVVDRGPGVGSIIAYAMASSAEIDTFLLMRARSGRGWTDVICRARLLRDGIAEVETHPKVAGQEEYLQYGTVLTGLVWRALALLAQGATVRRESVPVTRRPKLARAGVAGWHYRVVEIDPARVRAAVPAHGGTHASPCWHIRRGHYRTLADGRRTFVRACEVGDPARGGVVKDYRVLAGVAP
jgi:hypothetical protein